MRCLTKSTHSNTSPGEEGVKGHLLLFLHFVKLLQEKLSPTSGSKNTRCWQAEKACFSLKEQCKIHSSSDRLQINRLSISQRNRLTGDLAIKFNVSDTGRSAAQLESALQPSRQRYQKLPQLEIEI